MENRYQERGYSTTFREDKTGTFIDIRRNGKIITSVVVGVLSGLGEDTPVQMEITRYSRSEFQDIRIDDEYEDEDSPA